MNKVTLRRFRPGDEYAVSDLIRKTLAVGNRKDYPPEFIKENISSHSPEMIAARASELSPEAILTAAGRSSGGYSRFLPQRSRFDIKKLWYKMKSARGYTYDDERDYNQAGRT